MNRPRIVVYVPRQLGGVQHVTESLCRAIEHHGRTVVRAHGVLDVVRARILGRCEAAILSLETGYLAGLFARSVYILHGFPVVDSYSALRRVAVRAAARVAKRGGARLVAVSHLTRAVYQRLYGVGVDAVIFNGCSETLEARVRRPRIPPAKRKQVAYVGRLIEGKGLRRIVIGFLSSQLPSLGYTLAIAGSGPMAGWIAQIARENPAIELLGEIPEPAKEDLLFHSEAFVSLNDFEPMGVVFVEAVLTGCKIVAPYCGGHREFVADGHPVSLCDASDKRSVSAAFDRIPELATPAPVDASAFSYRERIAPEYLRILDNELADVVLPGSPQRRNRSTAA